MGKKEVTMRLLDSEKKQVAWATKGSLFKKKKTPGETATKFPETFSGGHFVNGGHQGKVHKKTIT